MPRAVVNVSYCAAHRKSPQPNIPGTIAPALHAAWLEECVDHWLTLGYPVTVSAVCWPLCISSIACPQERAITWRIFAKARFLTLTHDSEHQLGASWALRLGLDFALNLQYDYLIHTAEDVVPCRGMAANMLAKLDAGLDYAGSGWTPGRREVNAQFFGCRASACAAFEPNVYRVGKPIEEHLFDVLEGKKLFFYYPDAWGPNRLAEFYETTHDYDEWKKLLDKVR
jgi:hypothetical protein